MCGKDVQKRNFLSLKTEKKVKEITLSIIGHTFIFTLSS